MIELEWQMARNFWYRRGSPVPAPCYDARSSARADFLVRSSSVDRRDPPGDTMVRRANEPAGSVTRWIGDLKAGDTQALGPLWNRYYATLVERARAKLFELRSSTAASDEEDLAVSAFNSLHEGLRQGRFPRLDDRDDLWRLLVHLTACKAVDRHRALNRQKRGGGMVFNEVDMMAAGASDEDNGNPLDRIIGAEPSPEFAAIVAEEYSRRLDELGDQNLRRIAELKLACFSNEEIREQLNCSLRSVTLKLELIRKKWRAAKGAS
jgi:DNA-directed RNA polymerase specialized sigma24 family protein